MPTYEYECPDCGPFSDVRPMAEFDQPQPCPDCGAPIQRIRYADNETNYCARCQTGGQLLADRSLSRLLKQDWPRSIDEVD